MRSVVLLGLAYCLAMRIAEMLLSRRNAGRTLARGGRAVREDGFGALALVHGGWFAALIAEAQSLVPPARSITVTSEGRIIVYGTDELTIEAAARFAVHLPVTIVLTGVGALLPPRTATAPL